MEIKAADVMKLRKMTGAGMMDCKKALQEAEGDFERAKDIIREKGKLVVSKRADRSASEGVVVTKIVGQKAYLLCLACETDFVAQNSEFTASANQILDIAVANDAADIEVLKAIKSLGGVKTADVLGKRDTDSISYLIESQDRVDIRKPLFALLSGRNWPLIGLEGMELSLEDIFMRLVGKEKDKEDKKLRKGVK